ncbi:MAG: glycoside hydrolase family 3 N-terminal domain-containing protein [Chloroflexota bacterium]
MLQSLTPAQTQWVEKTLSRLSLEESVAQLLCISQFSDDRDYWLRLIEKTPVGAARARSADAERYREFLTELQQNSAVPLLVPANMENGATELRGYGTGFPWAMGMGAANDEALMAVMGQAIATEARYIGVNWVFNPVIDINFNPDNPITNIRSMGDNPAQISRLAVPWLQAMQQHGVAATPKHFPGDGVDDRDQHLVTTVNSLPFSQWIETFGFVWKAVIEAGVMCIMPGHISLPDYEGYQQSPQDAPPATLSRKLLIDLLRQELGYEGMIVSDNASMIGFTIHANPDDLIVDCIAAGNDIYLNADPEHDFDRLMRGVQDGRIAEEQIYASAKRVLEMKARLNLFEDPFGPAPTSEEQTHFQEAAQLMADKSITVLRNNEQLSLNLASGAKVLTVTYGQLMPRMGLVDLEVFDAELTARGFQVEHLHNPSSDEVRDKADEHDAVFINLLKLPMMPLGTARMTDTFRSWGWRSLYVTHPNVAYTSFGSPYVAYELPPVPRLIATYGNSGCSQKAAVKVWLGEIEALGTLPVRMPAVEIKPLSLPHSEG